MLERIKIILNHYQLSPSGFADGLGVPRSSISHLLSGRNKPSLDFVMKLVRKYPEVNLYWLLHGEGTFPADPALPLAGSDRAGAHRAAARALAHRAVGDQPDRGRDLAALHALHRHRRGDAGSGRDEEPTAVDRPGDRGRGGVRRQPGDRIRQPAVSRLCGFPGQR